MFLYLLSPRKKKKKDYGNKIVSILNYFIKEYFKYSLWKIHDDVISK